MRSSDTSAWTTWTVDTMPHIAESIMNGSPRGIIVSTSGSTGQPRGVLLSAQALRASASASVKRLGIGPWICALPVTKIGGFAVWLRSAINGAHPASIDPGNVSAATISQALALQTASDTTFISLVPTQLRRLLNDPQATTVLPHLTVLVGGAAVADQLVRKATQLGATVVRSYGMTETTAGCVFDGQPLDGVSLRLTSSGVIEVSGPILATEYVHDPEATRTAFTTDADGIRWYMTQDLGSFNADGQLHVIGRRDDIINTGGVKVAPQPIEATLSGWAGIDQVCVVPVPDDDWGQAVVAVFTTSDAAIAPTLDDVRAHVTQTLDATRAPRHILHITELPLLPGGKVDRQATTRWAATRYGAANN